MEEHKSKFGGEVLKDLKEVLFDHCSAAADKAIIGPDDPINREGGNREQEAKFSALLGVIAAAGLGDEWRTYRERETKTIPATYSEEKGGRNEMAEVARYQLGETTVVVYDDAYKGKSQEEINAIMRQAAAVVERHTRIPRDWNPQTQEASGI